MNCSVLKVGSFQLQQEPPCAEDSASAWSLTFPQLAVAGAPPANIRKPFGAEYFRCVDVPVVLSTAAGARPRSDIERRYLAADRPTCGARLGTRIPAAALDERLPGACGFVFEKSREHASARVGRGFREAVVRHDDLHRQVFDGDGFPIRRNIRHRIGIAEPFKFLLEF